jgi:hypothetical protein
MKKIFTILLIMLPLMAGAQLDITKRTVTVDSVKARNDSLYLIGPVSLNGQELEVGVVSETDPIYAADSANKVNRTELADTAAAIRGDIPAGGGEVDTSGLPVAGQLAYFTEADKIGGDSIIWNPVLRSWRVGDNNTASGEISTVSGGQNNTASGEISTVSGGEGNTSSGELSTVSGGDNNTASGLSSTIPGGRDNTTVGSFSTASGGFNYANDYGEFVVGVYAANSVGNSTSNVAGNVMLNIGNGVSGINSSIMKVYKDSAVIYGDFRVQGETTLGSLIADSIDVKKIKSTPLVLNYSATATLYGDSAMNRYCTLTGDINISLDNMARGATYTLKLIQDGTGGHTPTFSTGFDYLSNESATFSEAIDAINLVVIYVDENGNGLYSISTYTP